MPHSPATIWQRSYYEHVVRSEAALERLRAYIDGNPARWEADRLHPDNPSKW
jgi:REP element-mobilizing transposase RayT